MGPMTPVVPTVTGTNLRQGLGVMEVYFSTFLSSACATTAPAFNVTKCQIGMGKGVRAWSIPH